MADSPHSNGTPSDLLELDRETTICFCHNVSLGRLIEEIEKGAITLDLIKERTCASTGCGGCEPEVCEILEALRVAKPVTKK